MGKAVRRYLKYDKRGSLVIADHFHLTQVQESTGVKEREFRFKRQVRNLCTELRKILYSNIILQTVEQAIEKAALTEQQERTKVRKKKDVELWRYSNKREIMLIRILEGILFNAVVAIASTEMRKLFALFFHKNT